MEAICQSSQDSVVLVQRSLLDFLLLAFPIHNKQLTKADMAKIMRSVIKVVLRRDMSLNRRLYTWLLGTGISATTQHQHEKLKRSSSSSSDADLGYFFTFSKDLLIQALKVKLAHPTDDEDRSVISDSKSAVLKPFRILISLLDKPDIGPIILENVLLSVFRCLYRECNISSGSPYNKEQSHSKRHNDHTAKADTKSFGEIIKTANLLFGTFEPYFIWDYIGRVYEESCSHFCSSSKAEHKNSVTESDPPTLSELCQLVDYLLDIVSLVSMKV